MAQPLPDDLRSESDLHKKQPQGQSFDDFLKMKRLTSSDKGTLYFAYGSNLSTTQMQQRCPSSAKPLAIVKLDSYSWFICDRGYANVTAVRPLSDGDASVDTDFWVDPSSSETEASTVWGLLYLLTPEDETSLDANEGWHEDLSGGPNPSVRERNWKPFLQGDCSYNKLYLLVKVEKWLVDESERARFIVWSLLVSGLDDGITTTPTTAANDATAPNPALEPHHHHQQQSQQQQQHESRFTDKLIRTLIYVDEVRLRPGRINAEYIPRMSRAVKESVPLGIPENWVERTMRQHGIVWHRGDSAGKRSRPGRDYLRRSNDEEVWQALREKALREKALIGGVLGQR